MKIRFLIDNDYTLPISAKILLQDSKSMNVILILLAVSITVAGFFLFAFLWSVRTGQFEDDYSPASRILFDDKPSSTPAQSPIK